jgi:hypothetical protein
VRSDLWAYLLALWKHWAYLLTRGSVTAVVALWLLVSGHGIWQWVGIAIVVGMLIAGSFGAWRELYAETHRSLKLEITSDGIHLQTPGDIIAGPATVVRRINIFNKSVRFPVSLTFWLSFKLDDGTVVQLPCLELRHAQAAIKVPLDIAPGQSESGMLWFAPIPRLLKNADLERVARGSLDVQNPVTGEAIRVAVPNPSAPPQELPRRPCHAFGYIARFEVES